MIQGELQIFLLDPGLLSLPARFGVRAGRWLATPCTWTVATTGRWTRQTRYRIQHALRCVKCIPLKSIRTICLGEGKPRDVNIRKDAPLERAQWDLGKVSDLRGHLEGPKHVAFCELPRRGNMASAWACPWKPWWLCKCGVYVREMDSSECPDSEAGMNCVPRPSKFPYGF